MKHKICIKCNKLPTTQDTQTHVWIIITIKPYPCIARMIKLAMEFLHRCPLLVQVPVLLQNIHIETQAKTSSKCTSSPYHVNNNHDLFTSKWACTRIAHKLR